MLVRLGNGESRQICAMAPPGLACHAGRTGAASNRAASLPRVPQISICKRQGCGRLKHT